MFGILSIIRFIDFTIDQALQGNWTMVLIILAVCAVFGFILVQFSQGSSETPREYIMVPLLLVACLFLWRYAQRYDEHHMENFVGNTYNLSSNQLTYASPSEQGMWDFEMANQAKRKIGQDPAQSYEFMTKYQVVTLTAWRQKRWIPTRVHVLGFARESTDAPLVKVEAETNACAGQTLWIPAHAFVRYRSGPVQ